MLLLIFSCSRNAQQRQPNAESLNVDEIPLYHTWYSLKEMEYGMPFHPLPDEISPDGFFPWAGITSHHILAHEYLDAWFSRLAQMINPLRFYILSPDHYGVSLEPYSLTVGSWESGFGFVESDRSKVRELIELLEVDLDPGVFMVEHGVSALMPYIKKYFPQAKVVAIIHGDESPVNTVISGRLADVLENEFDETGKQENFLIISSDFSHKGGPEDTYINDNYSQQYLQNSANNPWNMVFCDNLAGIYILDRLGKNNLESVIFYHTNSWEISGHDKDDITSYFFVYFADK